GGLLDLKTEIIVLELVNKDQSRSRSVLQPPSGRSCNSETWQPRFRASPQPCRYPGEITITWSPGSSNVGQVKLFASAAPTVTRTFSAVAPAYNAAIRSRSSRVPFTSG